MSPDQVAFMERQQRERQNAPSAGVWSSEQESPNAVSILAAALMGALAGISAVNFVMSFGRSRSGTFKEPLM